LQGVRADQTPSAGALFGVLQLLLMLLLEHEHAFLASAVAAWLQLVTPAALLLLVVKGCSCPSGWLVAERR
jgi:hypothetical protein